MTDPIKSDPKQKNNTQRTLLVTLSAGCLTFVVAGVAILAGLLLDLRNDTLPRWTLIFLLGSAPLTLGGVYLLTRRALKRGKGEVKRGDGEGETS